MTHPARRTTSFLAALLTALISALLAGAANGAMPAAIPQVLTFGDDVLIGYAGGGVYALAAGDLNNDGHIDLLTGESPGGIVAWRNDGAFPSGWGGITNTIGSAGGSVYGLALADLDNDGWLDVASAASTGTDRVRVWHNDQTPFAGGWTGNNTAVVTASVYALAAADLDSDGWTDLVTGDSANRVIVWQNDKGPFSGTWPSRTVGYAGADVLAVAIGDLNRDGLDDLVSGDANGVVSVWRGAGNPFGAVWPAPRAVYTASGGADIRSLVLADLDSDGDLDIAVATTTPTAGEEGLVLQNPRPTLDPFGAAWAATELGAFPVSLRAIAAADLDQDGDLDLATSSTVSSGTEVVAWENGGSPFAGPWAVKDVGETGAETRGLVLADLDHDGDADMVAGTTGSGYKVTAWPNTRTPASLGNWTEIVQPMPAPAAYALAAADANLDGKTDLAAGTKDGLLYWNGDGGYTWVTYTQGLPSTGTWNSVAWAPQDVSLHPRLAAAWESKGLYAFEIQQWGTPWQNVSTGLTTTGTYRAVAMADLDHDGKSDLAAAGDGLGVRLWQALDGTPNFWTFKAALSPTLSYCDLALSHVNHDGDLDIVAANCYKAGVSVWTGDGGFGFVPATAPTTEGSYQAVAVGDIDHDGYADVAAAPTTGDGGGITVWTGDGGSVWKAAGTFSTGVAMSSLHLADFDRDGNLDLVAGTLPGGAAASGHGVLAWRGDGKGNWEPAALSLPTSGVFYGAIFARIDGDAALDIAAAESGSSGVRVWTAHEPPPGGWAGFAYDGLTPPAWSHSKVVTATVRVADAGSGLDVSTAQVRVSSDGGATWPGSWQAAACSGSDGTLAQQTITATNVTFSSDSAAQNVVQFRVTDLSGLTGVSPVYTVRVDGAAPFNPSHLGSTSHTVNVWSASAGLNLTWTAATDLVSGVWGYSWELSTLSSTVPDTVAETSGTSAVASAPDTSASYYFHLRAGDYAQNWSTKIYTGPFKVDLTAPGSPTGLHSDSHSVSTWSNDRTITMDWTAATDNGSGIAGYWYDFNTYQLGDPLNYTTTSSFATSRALEDGSNWYFNVRPRDKVGHKAETAAHFGPFWIDGTPPNSVASSGDLVDSTTFNVTIGSTDGAGSSGVHTLELEYKDTASGGWGLLRTWTDPATTVTYSATGQRGHTYCFRVRATDNAGNREAWPAGSDGDTCTSIATDLIATELEVTQVIQNLANSVPLVRDKETWVRVYLRSADPDIVTSGRLYGARGGSPLPGSPLWPEATVTARTDGGDRDNVGDALLFRLPLEWRNGVVTLRAVVNDDHSVPEVDFADNEHTQVATFQSTHTLCINMVRVHLHPNTASIDDPGFWDMVEFVRRWYPVADIAIYRGHTVYPYWHGFGSEWSIGDDIIWPLQKVWDYANGHDDPDECYTVKYFGMAHPDNFVDGTTPGIGKRPGYAAVGVMSLYNEDAWPNPWGGRIMAHEIGHNFGREHVLCTGSEPDGGSVDGSYPYPGTSPCRIAPLGDPTTYYGWFWPVDGGDFQVITPTEAADLMSYNWKRFPSDYTYRAFFGSLDLAATTQDATLPASWAQAGEYLRASGVITLSQNAAWLAPYYRQPTAKPAILRESYLHSLEATSTFSLALLGAGDALLYTHAFNPLDVTDQGLTSDVVFFGEVFPYNPATQRIVLYRDGAELGSRPVSAQAPVVTVTLPVDGASFTNSMDIAWSGSDPDGDAPLAYSVLYSADDGATWSLIAGGIYSSALHLDTLIDLPGSTQGRIRVLASDGVNTGEDITGRITVAPHPPEPHITLPRDGSVAEPFAPIVLRGLAIDTEDGPITVTEQFTWTVGVSGTVGTGRELVLPGLPAGLHVVTLTAQDSAGQTAGTSVTILVGDKTFLPVVMRQ